MAAGACGLMDESRRFLKFERRVSRGARFEEGLLIAPRSAVQTAAKELVSVSIRRREEHVSDWRARGEAAES